MKLFLHILIHISRKHKDRNTLFFVANYIYMSQYKKGFYYGLFFITNLYDHILIPLCSCLNYAIEIIKKRYETLTPPF